MRLRTDKTKGSGNAGGVPDDGVQADGVGIKEVASVERIGAAGDVITGVAFVDGVKQENAA